MRKPPKARIFRPLLIILLGLVSTGYVANASGSDSLKFSSEPIFVDAPFESCHASTIAETPEGLVSAWFGGPLEGDKNVEIWLSRKIASKWTAPVSVANGVQYTQRRYACWNPVLFQVPNGPLLLFYKVGPGVKEWWGMLTKSFDNGKSWSEPRRLPQHILGPVKNKPVMLADGTLICGSSTEGDGWRLHFEITRDLGKTWEITEPVNRFNVIQPSILVHKDGRLQTMSRSKENRVVTGWSSDMGKTWDDLEMTNIPNPNSGTDAVTLKNGMHILIYNHSERAKGGWSGPRFPLAVAVSKDGIIWKAAGILESQPGEYSYPAVIQSKDGMVHITYSCKNGTIIPSSVGGKIYDHETIKHVTLDPSRINFDKLKEIKGVVYPN